MAANLGGSSFETSQKQRRQYFYNHLSLLEFNESYMERKHKIPFNKDMFLVPNKKGFEVITHFLFTKLNEAIGKEEYKFFWPIQNKEQANEFRKTSHSYLNKISQSCTDSSFPPIVPSIFSSPGGERFYELYLAFSKYVLQKFVEKDDQVQLLLLPPLTSQNSAALQNVLELSTISLFKKFAKCQKASLHLHQVMQENAKDLIACHRNSKQILQDKELSEQKHMDLVASAYMDDVNNSTKEEILKVILQKHKQQLEKVRSNWLLIENFLSREKDYWEIVRTELEGECSKKYVLDGKDYILKMPESISYELIPELEKMKVHSVHKDGKLCITSFINLLIICLEYIIKLLQNDGLPKIHDVKQLLENVSKTVERNVGIIKSISDKIASEVALEMKQSVSKLEASAFSLHEEKIKQASKENEKHVELGLTSSLSRISLPQSFSINDENSHNIKLSFCDTFAESARADSKIEDENRLAIFENESKEESLQVSIPMKLKEEPIMFDMTHAYAGNIVTDDSFNLLGNTCYKQEPICDIERNFSATEEEIFSISLPLVPLFD